jgi:hypothetical protein
VRSRARWPALAWVAGTCAIAALLGGCGATTRTVVVQGPPTGGATSTTTTQVTERLTTATGEHSPTTTSQAPARTLALAGFQSPTGNIGCMLIGGVARCDNLQRRWSPPPRPPSCPNIVDFGQGLEVGTSGEGRFVCAGDTARDPTTPKLLYGRASSYGPFTCVSRITGMICGDRLTGHGFQISVQGYRVF